jgi:hypothetical protein
MATARPLGKSVLMNSGSHPAADTDANSIRLILWALFSPWMKLTVVVLHQSATA